jgi:hypothetical protein
LWDRTCSIAAQDQRRTRWQSLRIAGQPANVADGKLFARVRTLQYRIIAEKALQQ